ncbi:hypothetical protein HMPREF9370_2250 [Neisseria wadsworthii 9715]|uniref:Uncharacterized protein n=1 Tax=Neisseria wadsworthii 9715 TaxID=1030841 RepID=G4CT40_9NEIS|nr:hypothetical protein HMPREF9370_2250 [Neisseria wadsworthii 9715]
MECFKKHSVFVFKQAFNSFSRKLNIPSQAAKQDRSTSSLFSHNK